MHRLEAGNSIVYVIHAIEASVPASAEEAPSAHPLPDHNRTWHRIGKHSTIG